MWRTLFFRTPRLTALALLMALAGGLGALLSLGRQEDPTLVERYGYVLTTLPGADAERMEALVTIPIEEALKELPEIVEYDSSSRANVSQVGIEIDENLSAAEVDDAWTLIRNQVEEARASLPAGASVPEVERQYIGATTLITALVWEGGGEPELAIMSRMARTLETRLQNLAGTEETDLFGLPEEEIRVVVDPDALAAAGLSARSAAALIASSDSKTPAGQLRADGANLGFEIGGEFDSIARIRQTPLVQQADGTSVLVGDVARVEKGLGDPPRVMNFHNGKRAVLIGAFIQPNQRVDLWARDARAIVEDFAASAPRNISVDVVFDQSNYTNERLTGLARNLGFSALIVFAVLFFIMGWRSAIIVGAALPLTICLVLILFNVFGIPLHQMSVTGLVISLGLLIDNAIVVIDEYEQMRAKGMGRLEAIDKGLKILAGPLFASTLTTALAFAPIALLPGSAGEFVGMIGVSVIFSVVSSFVLSMTVIPALGGWFDRTRAPGQKRRWWRDGIVFDWLSDGYRWSVGAVLAFPPLGVLLGVAPAVAGFALGFGQPQQFFPQTERDQFQVEITLPPEASIHDARTSALRATEIIREYGSVTAVNWTLGEPSPRVYYNAFNNQQGVPGFASGWVQFDSAEAARALVSDIQRDVRAAFPEAQFLAVPFEQGPPAAAPIEFFIAGDDLATLSKAGEETRRILSTTPGVTYTTASLQLGAPTVTLRADEAATAMAGERLTDLAADLNAELEGALAGSVLEGVEEIPVRVIAPAARRGELSNLRSKVIQAAPGESGTPLSALGEITLDPDTAVISRRNGRRVNTIFAFLTPYALPAPVLEDYLSRLDAAGFEAPRGVDISFGGEAANRGDAIGDLLGTAVPLMLLMTGAVALVFNSFRMSFLILTGGLLSMGLAFFGVWLFNLPMGFNAILGGLGLLGIAINGSIVVLSALRNNPKALADDRIAQRETVVDMTRHIVATTLTTMGGFVPLILTGDQFWLPFAAGIAGGVAGSGLIALYFTPAVFRLMTMRPISRVFAWLFGARRAAPAPAE